MVMKGQTKFRRFQGALVGWVVLLLGVPWPLHAERITIATPSRGLFEFPVVVAMRKGFFKDEGIDVDKVQMQPALGVRR